MIESEFVRKARQHAEEVLGNRLPRQFVYHNLEHTSDVAKAARIIGDVSRLTDDQLDTVLIAAWLHDIGYVDGWNEHEQRSAATASTLLKEWGASAKKVDDVTRTILATRMPQNPQDIMGEVLCDADLHHLAMDKLKQCSENLRKELSTVKDVEFKSEEDWLKYNLNFLKKHAYFTEYGKTVLQPLKKQNAKKLKKELKGSKEAFQDIEKELEKIKKKTEKGSRPDRGIETMFRTTSENHVTLSGMADTKANIMISINTIILSIVVSVLLRKLEEFPHLLIPTLMLVITCLVTIVLAILATRPNIAKGKFTRDDIHNKKTNLLFFGNFHSMQLQDYEWGMKEMMKDYDYLYGSMIKDIYFLGKVLARKYKFLRLSYTVFMFGFVTSILTFILLTMIYYHPYTLGNMFTP